MIIIPTNFTLPYIHVIVIVNSSNYSPSHFPFTQGGAAFCRSCRILNALNAWGVYCTRSICWYDTMLCTCTTPDTWHTNWKEGLLFFRNRHLKSFRRRPNCGASVIDNVYCICWSLPRKGFGARVVFLSSLLSTSIPSLLEKLNRSIRAFSSLELNGWKPRCKISLRWIQALVQYKVVGDNRVSSIFKFLSLVRCNGKCARASAEVETGSSMQSKKRALTVLADVKVSTEDKT